MKVRKVKTWVQELERRRPRVRQGTRAHQRARRGEQVKTIGAAA